MKTTHVIIKTKGLSPPELVAFGQSVVNALSKNNSFPNLYPPLPVLEESVNLLNSAILNSYNTGKSGANALQTAVAGLKRTLKYWPLMLNTKVIMMRTWL